MAYKIAFFGAKPYDIASFDKINERYEFDIRYYKGHLNINNVVLTQGVDAVCIFVNDTADAAVIDALVANGVKLLALRCAGFNNVDLNAARGKLPVVRVPAYSPYAVAEYTLALMLSLNRKIHRAYWRTRDGNFSLNGLMGFDMHGKTAGIIGTGKIAKILIHILKGLGMRVLANDLYPDEKFAKEEGIAYVSLDELYKESDIISLHCPLTDQTSGWSLTEQDPLSDQRRFDRQDERRRNDYQYGTRVTDPYQRLDRGIEDQESIRRRIGCLRGGGRLFLRG